MESIKSLTADIHIQSVSIRIFSKRDLTSDGNTFEFGNKS